MAMEDSLISLFYQENNELRENLMTTINELKSAKLETEREIQKNKENMETITRLFHQLRKVTKERDEARDQLQKLLKSAGAGAGVSPAIDLSPDGPLYNNIFQGRTSSGMSTELNNISGESLYNVVDSDETLTVRIDRESQFLYDTIAKGRPLPKEGNLFGAVVKAGPLLRDLLKMTPTPRWQHRPSINPHDIPLPPAVVEIGGNDIKNQSRSHLGQKPFRNNSVLNQSRSHLGSPATGLAASTSGGGFRSKMIPMTKRQRI